MESVSGVEVAIVFDHPHDAATALHLVAVAGVRGQVAAPDDAPAWWRSVSAVVVDDVCAGALAAARLPRRDRVLVVTTAAEVGQSTWRDALALGAEDVLSLADAPKVAEWLARLGEPAAAGQLVCCLSARGGAGASTLACALGLAAAGERDVLLLDGDLQGGGIDYVLGMESVTGARWPQLSDAAGLVPAATLAEVLPAAGRLRVLAADPSGGGPVNSTGLAAVVEAALRGHQLVVADAGRGGSLARELTSYADATLLVVPCEVRAAVAAAALAREVAGRCNNLRLVIRQRSGVLRPEDVATAVGAPVAAVWPWDRRLAAVVESGSFGRSWQRTGVARVAAQLLPGLVQ